MELIKSKGHKSAENNSTGPKFELNLRILVTNLCTKFHLKISKYDLDNERKLNSEGRNDGMTEWRNEGRTEWRKGVTLYAPAISWRGHKNFLMVPWCDFDLWLYNLYARNN